MPSGDAYRYMDAMDAKTLGKELRRMRQNAGLTQVQLAESLEIAQTYVSKLERGGRHAPTELAQRWASSVAPVCRSGSWMMSRTRCWRSCARLRRS